MTINIEDDVREFYRLSTTIEDDINTLLSSDDTALDTLQEMVDSIKDTKSKTETNTDDITTNRDNIATNTNDIGTNSDDIATNANNISTNASNISTNDAYVRKRSERADYCRRIEAALVMSHSATYSSDQYLKLENRLIAIGMGSDDGMYCSDGHFSVHVPDTDTVIKGHGNADDVTVTDDGILMKKCGSIYCQFDDSQGSSSKDTNWHYVGYGTSTGIIPENWILIATFNDDMDAVTISGQTVQMGRVIYAQSVSGPILGTNLQNVGGVVKYSANNVLVGKPIAIRRVGDILTDGFINDWKEYDSNWQCNISKDGFGVVTMTGLVTGGSSGSDIGNLPIEYRPTQPRILTIQQCASEEFERMNIYNDGKFYCDTSGNRSGTSWMSINLSWQSRVEV